MLFREERDYCCLGDLIDHHGNIETERVTAWLKKRGVDATLISRAPAQARLGLVYTASARRTGT